MEESRRLHYIWSGLNITFFTLIPKSQDSLAPSDFRSITLSNFIYKILSTILVRHLKPILHHIINQEQSSFVEGRQILDGIVLTHETIHSMQSQKTKVILLKLDFSKAYDWLNWDYLLAILKAFGFGDDWVHWIRSLISTPFFSILINDSPSATLRPSRGIRQGDPICPFLFIITVEGLGRMIKATKQRNLWSDICIHGTNVYMNHQ